jgi:hypothetical protein
MEKRILIETLGQIIFNPDTGISEKYTGRRILCDSNFVFESATLKPITAKEFYENMSRIPDRREFLILDSGIQYPEEYKQMNNDVTSKKRIISRVLHIREIYKHEWQNLELHLVSKPARKTVP